MSSNSIGKLVTLTSFGESHGPLVGAVLDGLPSGIEVDISAIQKAVDERKPNNNNFSTTRLEEDKVEIVSGLFEGKTTGAPIAVIIQNKNLQSADYNHLKDVYRPGHADYTYHEKYEHRDFRGGGRSSIRITAPIVACGELAHMFLKTNLPHLELNCFVYQVGELKKSPNEIKVQVNFHKLLNDSIFNFPIEQQSEIEHYLQTIKSDGDTVGGAVHVDIKGFPVGYGEPIFEKFQSIISKYMFSINTVKGLEFGEGFGSCAMKGSAYNDEHRINGDEVEFKTNHAGGLLGGISNGNSIFFNLAFKPISSIQKVQNMLSTEHEFEKIKINGRHDVCAVPRAVAIVRAYVYLALADLYKMKS